MASWDELFQKGEFRWREPHEQIVALVAEFRTRGVQRILDLGAGAGRHTVYLARQGFVVSGIDISETGLSSAREWLRDQGLGASLTRGDMRALPYEEGAFDAVISFHVVQHQRLGEIRKTCQEIHRALISGGIALVTFPTRRDRRYGQGHEIEPDTFIATIGPDQGNPHHYSSLAEVEALFQGFAIKRVELDERDPDGQGRHSHWNVLAEKE